LRKGLIMLGRKVNYGSHGFALIELLVVIAIIALLLSIIVPALKKTREHAKLLLCKSNLKSYGLMAATYSVDESDRLPDPWVNFYNRHGEYPGEPHRYCRWHNPEFDLTVNPQYAGPFWPYLETKKVHLCSTFIRFAKLYGDQHPYHVTQVPIEPNYNYSMNRFLGGKKMGEIKQPGEVFFFGEENIWLNPNFNSVYAFNDTAFCHDLGDWFGTFHNTKGGDRESGVVNAVFLDGHVQTVWRDKTPRYAHLQGQ